LIGHFRSIILHDTDHVTKGVKQKVRGGLMMCFLSFQNLVSTYSIGIWDILPVGSWRSSPICFSK
jgi:hypothetical protein